ncbi:hypothetical protein ERD78_16955 [Allopusillimonas soli]|uniref:Uncharacterized protein n=1 Tax=Allopusillimonas soli TaxID=659016 RepID=A0A853FIS1_9BURK|nr:hypothetical protein [Allopusillimonas soli]NYT38640.1 hypothetical protein [Allopusillimonas soli]TEA71650.1 hypothetical protein ERD78_16955 [Allopusillimonas soli]
MKTLTKSLIIAAIMAAPFAAQAHETAAEHQAWIEAQKIDIQPTLKITETQIPADQAGTNSSGTGYTTPSTSGQTMPSTTMPSSDMSPSSMPPSSMPSSGSQGSTEAPIQDNSTMEPVRPAQ